MHVDALLSHGQLYSWREVDTYPRDWKKEANLPATWDLRGLTLEQVETALRGLFDRHEPLRTTYHLRDGQPMQRIHSDLPVPVDRVDRVITDYGDPDRTTAALVDVAFPMTDSLCWRGVLVTTDNAPMFLSLSFSHLIVDVWSIIELESQFRALIQDPCAPEPVCHKSYINTKGALDVPAAPGDTTVRTVGSSTEIPLAPRELARQQREESWQGRQNSAERYWRRVLADDLTHQFPTLPLETTKHRIQATLHSHSLGGLAAQAAKQHGVSAPAVLMGLVAAGLAEHTGAERVAMSLMSSNRFAAEYQHVVGTMNQLIPVATTVDHRSTLAEHITALHWASAKAYRYSLYDLDRIAAMAAEAKAAGDHDCWFNHLFQCWFNYLQLDGQPCDAADENPAELVWTPVARQYGQPFDVRVTVKGGRTSIALRADPDVVSAQGVIDILRAVALGTQRAVTDPESSLKDLWSARAEPLAPTLFPPVTPAPPK